MAVTNTAAFGQSPYLAHAVLTAAKAAPWSGATNAVAFTSNVGTNGAIITGVAAIPRNTIASAAMIGLFYSPDNGTTLYLIAVGTMAVYTFAATGAPTPLNLTNLNGSVISVTNPLYVPYNAAGVVLYGASGVALADGIVLSANGTNL